MIFAQLVTADGGLFDLSTGLLNNSTGGYNFSITAPEILPSGVYDVQIFADFGSFADQGGPYYT